MLWDKLESHDEKNFNADWKKLETQFKESKNASKILPKRTSPDRGI